MAYIFLVLALVLNAAANILVKISSTKMPLEKPAGFVGAILHNYYLLGALILFALNVIFYYLALNKLKLSAAYPIMIGGGFLIITLFSWIYFQEKISSLQLAGILLIMLGVTFVAIKIS